MPRFGCGSVLVVFQAFWVMVQGISVHPNSLGIGFACVLSFVCLLGALVLGAFWGLPLAVFLLAAVGFLPAAVWGFFGGFSSVLLLP